MSNRFSMKKAIILSLWVGVNFSLIGIITYLISADEYKGGVTVIKPISSLSVTVLSLAMTFCDTIPELFSYFLVGSFVVIPVVFCIFAGWIIMLLSRLVSPKWNISEFWFGTILVIAYLIINVVEYLIVIPRNPM